MNNNDKTPESLLMAGLEPLSRRKFLQGVALTGMAVTTTVTAGCSTLLGRKQPPKRKYPNLRRDEVATLTKLTAVYLPTAEYGLPASDGEVPTLANIDYMVGHMSKQTRKLLSVGLWLLEHRSMVSFNFSGFSNMPTKQAREYTHELQNGNLVERGLLTTIFAMISLNYWRDPSTWDALNYWGPVSVNWGVKPLGNAPLPTA